MPSLLDAFERADVSVADALSHLTARVDRAALAALREEGTADAAKRARALLAGVPSALLLDAFVARTFDAAGAHEDALAVRLDALALAPRWDGAVSGFLLARTAASLRARGRGGDALAVAKRALAFLPAEPRVVAEAAAALDGVGRKAEAAAHRAYLYDLGVGELVLPGDAGDAERSAEPYQPDLRALEPLDDEGMARHLAASYVDVGLANHMLQGRKHAMACLRHGQTYAALGTLEAYAGGTPNASDAGRWIGWPVGATDYVATDGLLAAVEALLRTQKADRNAKDLRHRLAGARASAAEALAKTHPQLAREALFDRVACVRYRAARALPDDPMVKRVRAVESALPAAFRLLDHAALPDGLDVSMAHHGHVLEDASFPTVPIRPPFDFHPPHVERAPNARSKCKVCKVAIEAGELRLRVRGKHFPVETFYAHLPCAASGKKGPLLATTADERAKGPLLAVALGRTRLEVADREALLAACVPKAKPRRGG